MELSNKDDLKSLLEISFNFQKYKAREREVNVDIVTRSVTFYNYKGDKVTAPLDTTKFIVLTPGRESKIVECSFACVISKKRRHGVIVPIIKGNITVPTNDISRFVKGSEYENTNLSTVLNKYVPDKKLAKRYKKKIKEITTKSNYLRYTIPDLSTSLYNGYIYSRTSEGRMYFAAISPFIILDTIDDNEKIDVSFNGLYSGVSLLRSASLLLDGHKTIQIDNHQDCCGIAINSRHASISNFKEKVDKIDKLQLLIMKLFLISFKAAGQYQMYLTYPQLERFRPLYFKLFGEKGFEAESSFINGNSGNTVHNCTARMFSKGTLKDSIRDLAWGNIWVTNDFSRKAALLDSKGNRLYNLDGTVNKKFKIKIKKQQEK